MKLVTFPVRYLRHNVKLYREQITHLPDDTSIAFHVFVRVVTVFTLLIAPFVGALMWIVGQIQDQLPSSKLYLEDPAAWRALQIEKDRRRKGRQS